MASPAPIIDMHLHAMPADFQGPPPLGFRLGDVYPPHDPATEWSDAFLSWHKQHGGIQTFSPVTDHELRDQTLAVMEKRNIVGVVSAVSIDLMDEWREAAPERVIPALVP